MAAQIFQDIAVLVWIGFTGFMVGVSLCLPGEQAGPWERFGRGAWLALSGLVIGIGVMRDILT